MGAARRALAHWAAAANIRFVEAISKAESISASNSGGDGLSLITVAHTPENTAPFTGASSEASGRTRLFYTESGAITEADIALNPTQQFSTDGTPGTYDLEATLTHEVGHLLGLEHSGITGATMQPRQGKNGLYDMAALTPRALSDDDRAGVRALYGGRGEDGKQRAAVSGIISYAGGAPVFGANVWAEESETGKVSAGNITLANGVYRIEGLAAGSYRLWVEALDGTIPASEIASTRGSYAGLALNSLPPFRTQEIGRVTLSAGETTKLNAQLSSLPVLLNPSLIGLNEQLSTISLPLTAGRTYTIYMGGDGVSTNQISSTGINIASPFISVNRQSVAQQDFGNGLQVIRFDITISPKTPTGDYTVHLYSNTGEVACVAGALSIEGTDRSTDDLNRLAIVPLDALDGDATALVAGRLVMLAGAGFSEPALTAHGSEFDSTDIALMARHGAAAVNLIYPSGASAYVPLTQVGSARLGFRVPLNAEAGRVRVEVLLGGQLAATTAVEVVASDAAAKAVDAGFVEAGERPETARAPVASRED
ncbi:MAG TPA: matrixin family metalloprotease, partial [Pyrinomonadaceae bacterium]